MRPFYASKDIDRLLARNLGSTYPPTLAVLYAPLGVLPPSRAQGVVAEVSVLLVMVAAFAMTKTTGGRIPVSVAVTAFLFFPSVFAAVSLGQNSALSLALFTVGWALLTRGRPLSAGAAWGLFAYKPTWALAVAWLPYVVRQPRAYLGMAASAATFVALTLPFCGVQPWIDWLDVGRMIERQYETYPKWTQLSRDVPGLFRRFGTGPVAEAAGVVTIVFILAASSWAWRARRRSSELPATGPRVTGLLAGAVLSCPRFMYYDMTLAAVPFLVALAGWKDETRGGRIVLVVLACVLWAGTAVTFVAAQQTKPPVETVALIALWAWSILRSRRPSPDVPSSSHTSFASAWRPE